MAQGARGEGFVEVEGEQLPVLFTNRALAEAEPVIGRSMSQVLRERDISVGDTARLLHIGMEYGRREAAKGGKAYTLNDAYRAMDAIGYIAAAGVVIESLIAVLTFRAGAPEEGAAEPPPA